jgi:3-hydroxybutyryl-CoA dehydrogenase
MKKTVAVIGAGTMGSGIALCAAQQGFKVILLESNEAVLDKAMDNLKVNISQLVIKGKITADQQVEIFNNLTTTTHINDCRADILIEAIIEKLDAKVSLFKALAAINKPESIFASNTSSLSINELQKQIPNPERVAGLHFFNPAQLMKLVEVVQGEQTHAAVVDSLLEFCRHLGKTPVICKDSPGFIVNRVARHYYLEAMKLVELKIASFENVDEIMEASGFRMGPFKLMDLIGMDINLAVSTSLYDAFHQTPRFKPSPLQIAKVKAGELGRKSGKGFYEYNVQ